MAEQVAVLVEGIEAAGRQVAKRLARVTRVVLPGGLREPPLILWAITRGRRLRSARLLSAWTSGARTNAKSCR